MDKLRLIFNKLFKSEVFRYLFFGGLTTVVSLVSYTLCVVSLSGGIDIAPTLAQIQISNVISWIIAVAFAYITNKLFVFNSRSAKFEVIAKEITAFVSARLFSLAVELIWMWIAEDAIGMNNFIAKFIGQVIVVILNYIFSKLFIFRKDKVKEIKDSEQ